MITVSGPFSSLCRVRLGVCRLYLDKFVYLVKS